MKNALLIVMTAALMSFAASDSQAQMFGGFGGYGGGGNGFSGGAGGYYGGCNTGVDPRLGYCLENDCFCSGNAGCFGGYRNGYGAQNGCCGNNGGCGNNGCCGNNGGLRFRVTIRKPDGTSTVRMVYPQNNGCGCANSNNGTPTVAKAAPRTARTSRYTASHRIPRATASAKRPSTRAASGNNAQAAPTNTAKYRYRF